MSEEIKWLKVKYERGKNEYDGVKKISVEVEITDNDFDESFNKVQAKIDKKLGYDVDELKKQNRDFIDENSKLRTRRDELVEEIERAKLFHSKISRYFELLGLNPTEIFSKRLPADDIPF